jgi:two-component system, NarL family, sensor kinase
MNKAFLTLLLFSIKICSAQTSLIDSLQKVIRSNAHDTVKLEAYTSLSWEYVYEDLNKAMYYADEELKLATSINNQKYIAQALNDKGIVLIRQFKFQEALEINKKALEIRIRLNDRPAIGSSYSKLAHSYTELEDYQNALDYQLKALLIFRELGLKRNIAFTLNNINNLYDHVKNYDKIEVYATEAYKMLDELHDTLGMANSLHYLGMAAEHKGDIKKALDLEKKALGLFMHGGDSTAMAGTYNNIGYFYRKLGNPDMGFVNYSEALKIAELIHDSVSAAMYSNNIANIFTDQKNFTEAEKYLNRALSYGSRNREILSMIYRSLAEFYVRTNKPDLAAEYFDRTVNLKDSLFGSDLSRKLSEMQVRYEVDKREKEKELLAKENQLKSAQLNRSRLIMIFLIAGVVLLAVIFYLIYNRNRIRQQQRLQQELLVQQELRTKAVIEAEEHERVRIAKELHDGIGQQLSAAKLNISGLQGSSTSLQNPELLSNAIVLLDDAVKEVRAVSHNMMANQLTEHGLGNAIRIFIEKLRNNGQFTIDLELVDLDQRFDSTAEIVIYRILQEIMSNVIRHASATHVTLQVVRDQSELIILAEDNGKGFDSTDRAKLEGVGLNNIRSRVEYLNGTLTVDSHPGSGTTINIEIPLNDKVLAVAPTG